MRKPVFEQVKTKHTLNRVREEKMPFDWSINPYRGCAHGCSFCYARAFQGFLGLAADDEFQRRIFIKSNAAEALEAQLSKIARRFKGNLEEVSRHVGLVAIGTASDPYQPIEGKAKITRQCLEVLARYRIPVSITTRSPLILRDLDLLRELNAVSVNISLHTLNRDIVQRFEPAAPPPLKRLETVQQLNEHGITAGIFAAPILPYITDDLAEMEELMAKAGEHKASFAMISLLRLSREVKVWFFRTLQEHYPHLVARYAKLYATGYADRSYAEPLMQQLRAIAEKYGLDKRPPETEFKEPRASGQPHAKAAAEPEQLSFPF